MVATVPSMIGQFNMNNIQILQEMGYEVLVAADFTDESVWPREKCEDFCMEMNKRDILCHQIDFSRNPLKINRHLKSYKQLLELVRINQYNFIHTHTPIASAIIRIVAHRTHTKVIYTAHGFHFYDGASWKNWLIFYPIEKFLSRWTDVLITINEEDYKRAVEKLHAKEVVYVPGVGVDTKKFGNCNIDKKEKRAEFGIPDDAFVLISVGELQKRKNQKVIIEALNILKNPDIYYIVVGQGILKAEYTQLITKYRLEQNVRLLGFRTDVAELLNMADICVFPSYSEGLPVALMEAMAVGLPIVCSKIRGNVDLVKDNQGGFLCNPDDIGEFAEMIDKVIENGCDQMGRVNKENIRKFDVESINECMKEIYFRIV